MNPFKPSKDTRRKFPLKKDRLRPEKLAELFTGFFAWDHCGEHPGVPLSSEKRLQALTKMSASEMLEAREKGHARDAQRYREATGYDTDEIIPWVPGIKLLTGTRYPSEGLIKLRKGLGFGMLTNPLASKEGKPPQRRSFSEEEINEIIEYHQLAGFTRTQFLSLARVLSEAWKTEAREARLKNISAARKKKLAHPKTGVSALRIGGSAQ
jgi:hypothetical protein